MISERTQSLDEALRTFRLFCGQGIRYLPFHRFHKGRFDRGQAGSNGPRILMPLSGEQKGEIPGVSESIETSVESLPVAGSALQVFISYSHKDQALLEKLLEHLALPIDVSLQQWRHRDGVADERWLGGSADGLPAGLKHGCGGGALRFDDL